VVHPDEEVSTVAGQHGEPDNTTIQVKGPSVGGKLEPARRARKILREGGERVLAISLSLVAAVGGLATFYHFAVAHARRVRRHVLPGAVVAVTLVIVVSWGFSLYVRTLASYTVYYGSLAAIAVLLVWLWLVSIAILVGAELNSQLEGLRDLPREPSQP
jgi:membrane protein